MLQHADGPRAFQDRCLRLVERAARDGDMSLRELAYHRRCACSAVSSASAPFRRGAALEPSDRAADAGRRAAPGDGAGAAGRLRAARAQRVRGGAGMSASPRPDDPSSQDDTPGVDWSPLWPHWDRRAALAPGAGAPPLPPQRVRADQRARPNRPRRHPLHGAAGRAFLS
ncbi:hypothetical protein FE772_24050 [Lysobacter enzymogenes]|nr:hypothetical protein [Lysobacter enzymogenes]QCW28263.1 hypothetical protein FE772_24050 [Lysobacter enzymogenes]